MSQLFGLYLVWFGFLVLRFSCQLREDLSRTRRLCGKYLVKEIEKLCGKTNWSQFQLEGEAPVVELISQTSKFEPFHVEEFKGPETPSPEQESVTNPASISDSQEEPIQGLKLPLLSDYDHEHDHWPHENTGESSSNDVNPHIHDSIKFQNKRINKIRTSQSLFWGNHPQRKRRGFSNKCCIKGCTKGELAIACLPYIHFYNNDKRTNTFD